MSTGVVIGGNAIPAEGTGAPVVVERHFGVDRPEVMRKWLDEQRKTAAAVVAESQGRKGRGRAMGSKPGTMTAEGRRRVSEAARARWAAMTFEQRRAIMLERAKKGQAARLVQRRQVGEAIRHDRATAVSGDRLLSVKQVAILLGCGTSRVRKFVSEGDLRSTTHAGPGKKRAKAFLIPAASAFALMGSPKLEKHGERDVQRRPHRLVIWVRHYRESTDDSHLLSPAVRIDVPLRGRIKSAAMAARAVLAGLRHGGLTEKKRIRQAAA